MTPAGRRILRSGIATAIAVAILVGLGSWQLARLAWKEALIARVAERMALPPAPAPAMGDWPTLDLDAWSYRRVTLAGAYDAANEARVYAVLSDQKGAFKGPGSFIMTPFRLRGGGVVVVNRGFAPEGARDVAPPPAGETTVAGVLREPEGRNGFTPDDAPARRLFFARDPKAIAAGLGLADVAPFTLDADAGPPGALPQGGETRVAFPNRHLEYALTWYGLAGALIAVFLAFAWRALKEGRSPTAPLSRP